LSTIPVEEKAAALAAPEFATIGAFYDAIKEQIKALGPSIFVKTTAPPQVVNSTSYSPDRLFPITDVETACRAIDLIKLEGEGTSLSPFEAPGDPAHYYRFGEIAAGRRLVVTPTCMTCASARSHSWRLTRATAADRPSARASSMLSVKAACLRAEPGDRGQH